MGILVCVFGPPGVLSHWAMEAIQTIVEVGVGPFHSIRPASVDDIRTALAERGERSIISFNDAPAPELCDLFGRLNAPILALYEEPAEVTGYCMHAQRIAFVEALRLTTNCLSALHDIYLHPSARLARRTELTSVGSFVDFVTTTFQIELSAAARAEIIARLTGAPEGADAAVEDLLQRDAYARLPGAYVQDVLRASDPSTVAMLQQYGEIGQGRQINRLTWPASLFTNGENPSAQAAERYELTGRARLLIFGPYLHVPAGKWSANVSFVVGQNESGNVLVLDIAMLGDAVAICEAKLPKAGQYKVGLEFAIHEPRQAIEVRVAMKHGAIEGWFSLLGVEMARVLDDDTQVNAPALEAAARQRQLG